MQRKRWIPRFNQEAKSFDREWKKETRAKVIFSLFLLFSEKSLS